MLTTPVIQGEKAPEESKNEDKYRERKELMDRGEGPMIVVMELEWKLRVLLEGGEDPPKVVDGNDFFRQC